MKIISQNFGKIALCGVVGSERKIRGFGILPNKQNTTRFTERVPLSYACSETFLLSNYKATRKEWKGIIKDGQIVVKNPLYQELPKREVIIKSGQTLYRFTGSYDGKKSLPSKVLRLMEQENLQKKLIKRTGADKMSTYNPVWQTARQRSESRLLYRSPVCGERRAVYRYQQRHRQRKPTGQ